MFTQNQGELRSFSAFRRRYGENGELSGCLPGHIYRAEVGYCLWQV